MQLIVEILGFSPCLEKTPCFWSPIQCVCFRILVVFKRNNVTSAACVIMKVFSSRLELYSITFLFFRDFNVTVWVGLKFSWYFVYIIFFLLTYVSLNGLLL